MDTLERPQRQEQEQMIQTERPTRILLEVVNHGLLSSPMGTPEEAAMRRTLAENVATNRHLGPFEKVQKPVRLAAAVSL